MKIVHEIVVLWVTFVSLSVIISAEDHIKGVPSPLGMLRYNGDLYFSWANYLTPFHIFELHER